MKASRAADHWRHLKTKVPHTKIVSLTYEIVVGLGSGTIAFDSPLVAISGPNGAGKSTLLRCLSHLLVSDEESFDARPLLSRGASGKIAVTIKVGQEEKIVARDFAFPNLQSQTAVDFHAAWLEPSKDSLSIIGVFGELSESGVLTEGAEAKILDGQGVKEISYVVGKEYELIEVYELEGVGERAVVPYYRVRVNGLNYGSEHMGLGEFTIFYALWFVGRLAANTILLCEEPECSLSPRSQQALMDHIAMVCDKRGISCVVSTHSPHILEKLSLENIRIVYPRVPDVSVLTPQTAGPYLKLLGLSAPRRGAILVEDECGFGFLQLVAGHFDGNLLNDFDVLIAGDEAKVLKLVELYPKGGVLLIVGVLDGDGRSRFGDGTGVQPIIFLPGEEAPEIVLLKSALKDANALSKEADKSVAEITAAIASCAGLDHHDKRVEMASCLGMSPQQFLSVIFRVWIGDTNNQAKAESFYTELRRKCELPIVPVRGAVVC